MIPRSCAASSASAICFAMGSASSSGIAPLCDALREVVALDQLHHECGDPAAFFEAVDSRDVRMVQRGEHFRFALKAREPIVVSRERRRQDLDRDLAFQLGIGGPIHLSHAAFADQRSDFVDAESSAVATADSISLSVAWARSLLIDAVVSTDATRIYRENFSAFWAISAVSSSRYDAGILEIASVSGPSSSS